MPLARSIHDSFFLLVSQIEDHWIYLSDVFTFYVYMTMCKAMICVQYKKATFFSSPYHLICSNMCQFSVLARI